MEIKTKQQGIKVVADVLDIVGGKWRGKILSYLCDKPRRFNELKCVFIKITSATLVKELRYLESIKIIEHVKVKDSATLMEYRLTNHGNTIKSLIQHMVRWGLQHRKIVFEK